MEEKRLSDEVLNEIKGILEAHKDFIGEKHLRNGFLIKNSENKATITLLVDGNLFSVKMVKSNSDWNISSSITYWEHLKGLVDML